MTAPVQLPAQTLPGLPRHEVWAILEWATGRDRSWLMARLQAPGTAQGWSGLSDALTGLLSSAELALAGQLYQRRQAGAPLAYLVGHREFFGHRFLVSPAVLIPRHESELLVEHGLDWLDRRWQALGRPLRVLDLGTGSGCLAISLALGGAMRGLPLEVTAVDASAQALAMARNNALWLRAEVTFLEGRWWSALPATKTAPGFDLVVSNPPYLCETDSHLMQGDLPAEPRAALVGLGGNADGLQAYRELAAGASDWLAAGGCLMVEHGHAQQADVLQIFSAGLAQAALVGRADLAGLPRLVSAQLS